MTLKSLMKSEDKHPLTGVVDDHRLKFDFRIQFCRLLANFQKQAVAQLKIA